MLFKGHLDDLQAFDVLQMIWRYIMTFELRYSPAWSEGQNPAHERYMAHLLTIWLAAPADTFLYDIAPSGPSEPSKAVRCGTG